MPDLVTHFAAAYFLKVPFRRSRFRIPFYLGAILPDLLTRPVYIIYPPAASLIYSLHTPAASLLVCLLLAQFFEKKIRSGIRINLLSGIVLHFALDFLQKEITVVYYWLFPLSWKTFNLGLFWPGESLQLVPVWLSIMLVIEATILLRNRISKRNPP